MAAKTMKRYDIVNGANDQLATVEATSAKAAMNKWRRELWHRAPNARGVHAVLIRDNRARRKRATSRRKKNPVRVAASMAGKSTGWMPAKAVRVVKGKGGQVRVDVKR